MPKPKLKLKNSNRLRRYRFSVPLFRDLFIEGTEVRNVRVAEGWPKDAEIVGFGPDNEYSFSLIVSSKTFDKVIENTELPEGSLRFERINED